MLGIFKIWINWKLKDFQINWVNILFIIEHKLHFTLLSTKWAHFKFDACIQVSKKLARGEQRAEKVRYFENIQLGEYLATN